MSTFIARYQSSCPECDEPIDIGDECVFAIDRLVVHLSCQPTHHAADRCRGEPQEQDVCPSCFTVRALSGACGC